MCTQEVWTYSECGCTANHYISCTESLRSRQTEVRLDPASERWENISSTSVLTDDVGNTDMQNQRSRTCSIHRTLQKQFLERICDDCLLHELGVAPPVECEKPLISNSDLKIEVNAPEIKDTHLNNSEHAQSAIEPEIFESNVEVEITEPTEDEAHPHLVTTLSSQTGTHHNSSISSRLSLGDADSESSDLNGLCRGRARSRTKQIRRMAMDVSREDIRPRISSRLHSFQRHSLKNFKDELQGHAEDGRVQDISYSPSPIGSIPKPLKSLRQRFAEVRSDGWSKAKETVQDLSRSISQRKRKARRRHQHGEMPGVDDEATTDAPSGTTSAVTLHTTAQSHMSGLIERQIDALGEQQIDTCPSKAGVAQTTAAVMEHDDKQHKDSLPASDETTARSISTIKPARQQSLSRDTWQEHLSQDMSSPRRIKQRHMISRPDTDDTDDIFGGKAEIFTDIARLSGSSTSTAASSRNWRFTHPSDSSNPFSHSSFEYSTNSGSARQHSAGSSQLKQRLLSNSSRPSIPGTASDVSVLY
jgi:hypothetical protein